MAILAFSSGGIDIKNWPFLSFIIIKNILQGLEDILNKLLLTEKYMLPHVLIFLRGLYNSGMFIVLVIIIQFSGFEFIISVNFYKFFIILLSIIIWFCYSFFAMKIIYIFTPHHISFLSVVFYMFVLIFHRISNNYSMVLVIFETIIFLFMAFSTLLFSEMIIINKWGLNKNTKKNFLIKEKQEFDDGDIITELINDKGDKYDEYEEKQIEEMPE